MVCMEVQVETGCGYGFALTFAKTRGGVQTDR